MPLKEMLAVALAIETFNSVLSGSRLVLHSDSEVVIKAHLNGSSHDQLLTRVHRAILSLLIQNNIKIELAAHIKGLWNVRADVVSRLKFYKKDAQLLTNLGLTPMKFKHPIIPIWMDSLQVQV